MSTQALALPSSITGSTKSKSKSGGSKTDAVRARARAVAASARENKHMLVYGGELLGTGFAVSLLANSIGSKFIFSKASDGTDIVDRTSKDAGLRAKATWVRPIAGHALSDLRLWLGLIGGAASIFWPKKPNAHGVAVSAGLLTSYAIGLGSGWGRKMISKDGAVKDGYATNVAGADEDEIGGAARQKRIAKLREQIQMLELLEQGYKRPEAKRLAAQRGGGQPAAGGRRLIPMGHRSQMPAAGGQQGGWVYDRDLSRAGVQGADVDAYLP